MLELILVCTMALGQAFAPPAPWTVDKVETLGSPRGDVFVIPAIPWHGYGQRAEQAAARVTLRRPYDDKRVIVDGQGIDQVGIPTEGCLKPDLAIRKTERPLAATGSFSLGSTSGNMLRVDVEAPKLECLAGCEDGDRAEIHAGPGALNRTADRPGRGGR